MSTPAVGLPPLLVIEDEPSVMAFVVTTLRRYGYQVECASNGAHALEMLAQPRDFSAVITDMRMPGGVDGADVYQWLKLNRSELASRLLFITGDMVNDETARTLVHTGAPYVEKPFRILDFMTAVRKLLDGGEA